MKYFGPKDFNPPQERTETPVGEPCSYCEEPIKEGDRGFTIPIAGSDSEAPYHHPCFIRTIIGSVGHQQKKCSCYGGTEEDPPDMTKREAALAAFVESKNNPPPEPEPGSDPSIVPIDPKEMFWNILPMVKDAGADGKVIQLQWGWTAGFSEEDLKRLADDSPRGYESVTTTVDMAKELVERLNKAIKEAENGSLTFKEAQEIIRGEMEGVLDDDYPDNLDRIAVILIDEHGMSDAEAEEVIKSEWYIK